MSIFWALDELNRLNEAMSPKEGDRVQMDYYSKSNNGAKGLVTGRIGELCWVTWDDGTKSKEIKGYLKVLDEPDSLIEASCTRQELIDRIKKASRKNYNLDKFPTPQLYAMCQKIEKEATKVAKELNDSCPIEVKKPTCDTCGTSLADSGICPVCDDGEEFLEAFITEGIFDSDSLSKNNWVSANGVSVKTPSVAQATAAQPSQPTQTASSAGSDIVTIVYDYSKHKLRAQADDGVHGKGWVAFPSDLRNTEGQQYKVDQLIWNGKNYRASGNITPITNVGIQQIINEKIIKENYEMNFQTVLEELNRIYEELPAKEEPAELDQETVEEVTEDIDETADTDALAAEEVEESCTKALTEDEDEEVLVDDEPIIDDEAEETEEEIPEESQVVLECSKCGALILKAATEIEIDEETDLVKADNACQYCEDVEGYKIIGTLAPYNATEESENLGEGIFDSQKTKTDLRNLQREFDSEVEKLIGEPLGSLYLSLAGFLRDSVREWGNMNYRDSKNTHSSSYETLLKSQAKLVYSVYENVLKDIKKPNNFIQAYSVIERAIKKILNRSDFIESSNTLRELDRYRAMSKIWNIKLSNDKLGERLKKEALKKLFERLYNTIQQDYQNLKKKNYGQLFEGYSDGEDEELEEGIFNQKGYQFRKADIKELKKGDKYITKLTFDMYPKFRKFHPEEGIVGKVTEIEATTVGTKTPNPHVEYRVDSDVQQSALPFDVLPNVAEVYREGSVVYIATKVPETVNAENTDEPIEEGIFDSKKTQADMNNTRREFEGQVTLLPGNEGKKKLSDLGYQICTLLRSCIDDLRIAEEQQMKGSADSSKRRIFTNEANRIFKVYEELLKNLKKPNSIYHAYNYIEGAAREILGKHASSSFKYSSLKDLRKIFSAVDDIPLKNEKVGKKVKKEAIVKFYEQEARKIAQDYELLKKKPKDTLFEGLEETEA